MSLPAMAGDARQVRPRELRQDLEFRPGLDDEGGAGLVGAVDLTVPRNRRGGELAVQALAVQDLTGGRVVAAEDALLGDGEEIAEQHRRANVRPAGRVPPRPLPRPTRPAGPRAPGRCAWRYADHSMAEYRRRRHPGRHAVELPELFASGGVVGPHASWPLTISSCLSFPAGTTIGVLHDRKRSRRSAFQRSPPVSRSTRPGRSRNS